MIHAGELRHLAKFKEATVVTTDGDTAVDPFVESFEGWVSVDPVAGSEETIGDQVQVSVGSLVKMRYDSRVNTRLTMYLRDADQNWTRRFEILSVLDIDLRHIELQLTCRELV